MADARPSPPALDAAAIARLAPSALFSLRGRTALVTGAAVVVSDIEGAALGDVAAALRAAGIEATAVVADLADETAPDALVDAAVEAFGGLHVVVNNAAVNRRGPILEMDGATWDLITRLDLRAPYFLSQRAARRMIEQGDGGSIVSISSVNAQYGLEQVSVYGPAKAALSQLMRVMALEWAPHGIRANAIAPGFMDTPLAAPVWADPDVHRWILNRVPAERPGRPDELIG